MRAELAAFLRDRRARVRPSDVGLPAGPRRRTPGLRREEVAQLAHVGASWYTWLEQGRDIHASEAFLERLSGALRLSAAERSYLFQLAQGRAPRPVETTSAEVTPALQRALDGYTHPAVAITERWDIAAVNRHAVTLFGKMVGQNSLVRAFTDHALRARIDSWEYYAARLVARFRVEASRAIDRAPFDALAAEITKVSPEFARLWRAQDVLEVPEITKTVAHPAVGSITFDCITLLHVEPSGRTLRIALDIPQPGVSSERAAALFK